ncbi:RHS repeat-associated core domain-containing protein [Amycolatopsis minnesotensis]|uniref:RHS repeat-associated core domain-containing protein n=1 Tax=Amycolatopsis minnesotensis TaxID=337894 RepID=A0ABP5CDM5_9PSEU
MPEGNPLVAQAQSQTTAVTGIGIAESSVDLANGVKDGSWVEGGLGALGVGLEALSLVVDPIGTLAQYGVSWLIEHVQPLKEALDWLAGNPPVIQSFSDTWANVAKEVNTVSGDLANEVKNGTAGWKGTAADAYRASGAEQVDAIAGAATLADGISVGVMIMGQVVAMVRETVRDLVAELIGKLISWALEEACTLGFATPLVAVQATTAITKAITKVGDLIRKLVKTIGNVTPKIRKIIDKLGEIMEKLAKLGKKLGGGGTSPSAAKSAGKHADTPGVHGDTTPSGTHGPDGPDAGVDGPGHHGDGTSSSSSPKDGGPNRPDDPNAANTPEKARTTCNDPVDVATGEVIAGQTDITLDGVLPLVLRRTHVSSYRAGRGFGRSWASTVDQRLELDAQGIVFVAEDGMLLCYPEPSHSGAVVPASGPRWPLSRTETGYRITRRDLGHELLFDGEGTEFALSAIADRNGNRITFERDQDGLALAVWHSGGHRIEFEHAGSRVTGLLLRNFHGDDIQLARFGYNTAGDLTEVVNSSGRAMRFEYDAEGRIVTWTDRNGEWYRYFYDDRGRCIANQGSGGALNGTFSYDTDARVTRFTDALGNTTTYRLTATGRVAEETDPLGNRVVHERDEADRLVATTDPLGRTTRFVYDDDGNVVLRTGPDGAETRAEYDEHGDPLVVVEPDGGTWRRTYDEHGNLLEVADPAGATTRYAYRADGALTQVTDSLGHTRRVETDSTGLPLVITDPLGASMRIRRDQFGRIVEAVDSAGGVSRFAWTVEGRLLSRTRPGGGTERWRYDGEGNVVEQVDALGQVTRSELTHFDLPAVRTTPDGARSAYRYDANLRLLAITDEHERAWTFGYDAAGRLTSETDVHGRTQRYAYDAAGQLVERVNAAGDVTTYEYDAAGNRVRVSAPDTTAEFEYDVMGRTRWARNEDADVRFERDALGRVLTESIDGHAVVSAYDTEGRRVRRRTPTGSESRWDYDANGNHVGLRTAGRSMSFRFDQAGREVERLLDAGTMFAQSWDANHRLVSQTVSAVEGTPERAGTKLLQHREYRYRADGRPTEVSDRLRGITRFDLDPAGRVLGTAGETAEIAPPPPALSDDDGTGLRTSGPVRYLRDQQGRIVVRQRAKLSGKPDVWRYSWNSEDRLVGVETPDGARWRYRYDPFGRRTRKERLGADGAVLEAVRFCWDGAELAEQIRSTGEATTWNWAPDSFRPLTQVSRAAGTSDQDWVDAEFFSIVTDLIGTPTELVDVHGEIAWRQDVTVWGRALNRLTARTSTPLRFPGQYHDDETGLHYNHQRYYDPEIAQYASADPLGAAAGADPYAYAPNPVSGSDPLGLALCEEGATKKIDEYRADKRVGGKKNIAVADYEINGVSGQRVGVSGKHQYDGSAPMPPEHTLNRGPDDIARAADSEMKIFEELKGQLKPDASGRIHIYSERPVCPSCQEVIKDFQRSFPNIKVTYSDLGRG